MKRLYQLHEVVEAMTVGAVFVDTEGNLTYCNDLFESFLRHEGSIDLVKLAKKLASSADEGEVLQQDIELSGAPDLYLQVTCRKLIADGEVAGTLVMAQDTTEVTRLNRVRSDFVANLSHELRTPVGAISVLAEAMAAVSDPSDRERLSERLQSESIRLSSLIEDLLNLSWLESNQYQTFEPVGLNQILEEVAERAAEKASSLHVNLKFETADGFSIRGERTQLVSALSNLVDNAIKHSEVGSDVLVQVRSQGTKLIQISVTNFGADIPTSEQSRIFERFYRVQTDRSRQSGGTGLGLAICRHVVYNHGGEIVVESGGGETKFLITLPINRVKSRNIQEVAS